MEAVTEVVRVRVDPEELTEYDVKGNVPVGTVSEILGVDAPGLLPV